MTKELEKMLRNRLKNKAVFCFFGLWTAFLLSQGCGKSGDTAAPDAPKQSESRAQTPKKEITLQIFAAAGTRTPTEEICDRYEKETNRKVERNYASSGTLARQIAAGAPADVFVSANKQWIDFLKDKKMLADGSVRKIVGNSLVLIAPKDSDISAPELKSDYDIQGAIRDKIAIGDPAYVPVGKYTKTVFEQLGWMDKIKDKMILAKDVSSVLRYVELGECDFGVVYRSEALQSKKVKIIAEVPGALHKPIEFFAADLKAAKPEGKTLSEAFLSKEGVASFIKFGFVMLPDTQK
jgi:molybdate transport system substrate-binding protein